VPVNDLFQVIAEIRVQGDGRMSTGCLAKDFGDGTSASHGCGDQSDWPMIFALDQDLGAVSDLGEDGANIAGEFGL